MRTKMPSCNFDRDGNCGAITCQQPGKECTARDENGCPLYGYPVESQQVLGTSTPHYPTPRRLLILID